MKVTISDLVPYECGAVRGRYEKATKDIESGKGKKPKVAILEDETMIVIDGNNSVKAALDLGHEEVEVEIDCPPDISQYELTAAYRKEYGPVFNDYPIFETDTERDKETRREMKAMGF